MPFPYTLSSSNTITSNSSGSYIENLAMEKRVPKILHSDFWLEFIDAWKTELALYLDYLSDIKEVWYIDKMESSRIVEVANTLNVPIDANVNSATEFLREELRATPFKIKYKSTALLYLTFLTAVERLGTLFIYTYTGDYLLRDSENLLLDIETHDTNTSIFQQSVLNFSGTVVANVTLDSGYTLDDGWTLDTFLANRNTNHTSIEFYCDRTITKDSTDYLMTDDYLSYLYNQMYWGKKGSEVAHIGCQVTGIADTSHTYHTLTDTGVQCATTASYVPAAATSVYSYVEFGTGSSVSVPAALVNKVAKYNILEEEKYQKTDWNGLIAEYKGKSYNDIDLSPSPDGSTTSFTVTLPSTPVKKKSVEIIGTASTVEYSITENGDGILTSDVATGTIDYDTGDVTLTTVIQVEEADTVIGTGDGADTTFNYTNAVEKRTNTESTFQFKYKINGITYVAVDDGAGNLSGIGIDVGSSSITYGTGYVDLVFSTPPDDGTPIYMTFSYEKTSYFDNSTDLKISYYTEADTLITEAGLFDSSDNLLAYMTFDPVEFHSIHYHLNVNFILKRSAF